MVGLMIVISVELYAPVTDVALIVAEPGEMAVILPSLSIVATSVLDELHVMVASEGDSSDIFAIPVNPVTIADGAFMVTFPRFIITSHSLMIPLSVAETL